MKWGTRSKCVLLIEDMVKTGGANKPANLTREVMPSMTQRYAGKPKRPVSKISYGGY